jgi:hypothetical protein
MGYQSCFLDYYRGLWHNRFYELVYQVDQHPREEAKLIENLRYCVG